MLVTCDAGTARLITAQIGQAGRVVTVVSDGVREIWLSSEDTGAYGRDIGVNLPILLNVIVKELPPDGSTMLRIGMTYPPFILENSKDIANILSHPCVYSFLHVPAQSGSDNVLLAMNWEYTVSDFRTVADTLTELVPGMQIATDIICGFTGETDEDFAQTVTLIKDYKFSHVHNSQFYPRPGTPAARMKKVPSNIVKKRSLELTTIFEAFTPYVGMEGKTERIWITEFASDVIHLVSYTKGYVQIQIIGPDSLLGTSAIVKIISVRSWSVFGEVIKTLREQDHVKYSLKSSSMGNFCSPCSEQTKSCEPSSCACQKEGCGQKLSLKEAHLATEPNIRQRKHVSNTQNQAVSLEHLESAKVTSRVDGALVAGIILSLVTIIQGLVLFHVGVLMISHDEHLISGSVDELWVVSEGTVAPFQGTFTDYKTILQSGGLREMRPLVLQPPARISSLQSSKDATTKVKMKVWLIRLCFILMVIEPETDAAKMDSDDAPAGLSTWKQTQRHVFCQCTGRDP